MRFREDVTHASFAEAGNWKDFQAVYVSKTYYYEQFFDHYLIIIPTKTYEKLRKTQLL